MQVVSKIGFVAGTGVLCAALISFGCRPRQSGAAPRMGPPEVAAVTMQAERVVIATELPGRVSAFLVAEVRPQVSGIVQERLFTEGSDVKAGDPLYQIDPAVYQAACANAEANLAVARKAADRARAALKVSLAGVERQQASLALAKTNRQRFEELVKDGAVSASQRDQAVTEADVTEAGLRAAEAQVENDRAAVAAADAAIQQAEAAVQTAQINLGFTKVTAPISGRIGKSAVTIGALATAYQPMAFTTIQQLDQVYVDAPQSSANLLRLKQNLASGSLKKDSAGDASVRLLLEDGSAYPVDGVLKFSDVTVDPTTGSFILRMVFPNPNGVLLPNMFVRAVVNEGTREAAILVPQQAVMRDSKGRPVALIVNAENKIEQRVLELDRAIGSRWLVTSGLAVGDRLVAESIQKVRPGTEVKTIPFEDGANPAAKTPGSVPAAATPRE